MPFYCMIISLWLKNLCFLAKYRRLQEEKHLLNKTGCLTIYFENQIIEYKIILKKRINKIERTNLFL